jgi:hypothetical protein
MGRCSVQPLTGPVKALRASGATSLRGIATSGGRSIAAIAGVLRRHPGPNVGRCIGGWLKDDIVQFSRAAREFVDCRERTSEIPLPAELGARHQEKRHGPSVAPSDHNERAIAHVLGSHDRIGLGMCNWLKDDERFPEG